MGHSEMLLAVAGLKQEEIAKRTKNLAAGNWNVFPAHERQAFQFAHKLTREPSAVGRGDIEALLKTYGSERTADLIWYTAWCNYMTRVADAFQLPLERNNVFAGPKEKTTPPK
jgi:alkylhydroperoxidase family enzyme